MEILIEAIGELIGAAFEALTDSPKVPKPIRVFITLLFFVPLAVLLILAALLLTDNTAIRVFFLAVALVIVLGGVKLILKIVRK